MGQHRHAFMEEPMLETARMWRYYVGAIKVLVPEGTKVVRHANDKTFGFNGYLGEFEVAAIPQLLKSGELRNVPDREVLAM